MEKELYDVVAVNIGDPATVRFLAEKKSLRTAEKIVEMAVFRRGVDKEFYAEVPTGKYKEGDIWME